MNRILAVILIILLILSVFIFRSRIFPQHRNGDIINYVNISITTMKLTSTAFENGGKIPLKYTCDGENINPPLSWSGAPEGTKSFALIMDDPDIPDSVKQARGIAEFVHWVVFNIPKETTRIDEGKNPEGVAGLNSTGKTGYVGSCPPDREHRYFFRLYALDVVLDLSDPANKYSLTRAMKGNILSVAELVGRYERKK